MILLTGGSGLLGTELQKHIQCHAPSSRDFNIINPPEPPADTHMIVHCAAYTDVAKAEEQELLCMKTNVIGTLNMVKLGLPIVYISTEYVFDGEQGNYDEYDTPNPINYYARTKLIGEEMCQKADKSLIIRCVFKPRPFKHQRACIDQWTSGDYVDVIAPLIAKAVDKFKTFPNGCHIINIGTERKSIYDLAARSNPNVAPIHREEIAVKLPKDTSLNLKRWEELVGETG